MAPGRRQHEPDGEPQPEQHRRVLVLEADPRDEAEEEPEARLAPHLDLDEDRGEAEPDQRLEGVHRVEGEHDAEDRRRQERRAGERLPERPRAEPPREAGREPDRQPARERRGEAEGQPAVAQQRARDPQQEDRQRRVVDVSPVETVGARDVVQLVDEEPVEGHERGAEPHRECRDARDLGHPDAAHALHAEIIPRDEGAPSGIALGGCQRHLRAIPTGRSLPL